MSVEATTGYLPSEFWGSGKNSFALANSCCRPSRLAQQGYFWMRSIRVCAFPNQKNTSVTTTKIGIRIAPDHAI
jgi:hypothetical protein